MRESTEIADPQSASNAVAGELELKEYEPLMSDYLRFGRRQEQWHINWIKWDGVVLQASARLEGWVGSGTDGNQFHLSIFAAREMEAQFGIVGMHLKLGLHQKTTEVWLLKCVEECESSITDSTDVRFEMRFNLRKLKDGKVFGKSESNISDARGGLIRLSTRAILS
jgi:hypothetical protein